MFLCAIQSEIAIVKATLNELNAKNRNNQVASDIYIPFQMKKNNYGIKRARFNYIVKYADMSNIRSAVNCAILNEKYKPDYVFLIGCCGGIKDCTIGDIIIPSIVSYYEIGKELEREGEHIISLYNNMSIEINNDILISSINSCWKNMSANSRLSVTIKVHENKELITGEKVLTDKRGMIYRTATKSHTKAIGVEMESGGVGYYFERRRLMFPEEKAVNLSIIRAVSDMCENKNISNRNNSINPNSDVPLYQQLHDLTDSLESYNDDDRQKIVVHMAMSYVIASIMSYFNNRNSKAA